MNYVISYKEQLDKTTRKLIEQKQQLIIQEQKEATMTDQFKETIRELIQKAKTDKLLKDNRI